MPRALQLSTLVVTSLTLAVCAANPQDPGETLFRLDDEAAFQEGCFPPCLCPIQEQQPVAGTFVMGPAIIGDVVDFREVFDVNWKVQTDVDPIRITGEGFYRVTNFGLPVEHALDLDLSIDGGEPQYFFSDFVQAAANDGVIDIAVSMNGMYCHDTVIRVSAAPVPVEEVIPYRLGRGSTYQQDCDDPCDCGLESPLPMRGRFGLVPIDVLSREREWAVVSLDFFARTHQPADPITTISGHGFYGLARDSAGSTQSMQLDLAIGGGELVHFERELADAEPISPHISVVLDAHDHPCNPRLTIEARPVRQLRSDAAEHPETALTDSPP
ncbi:MAG: hypothetical protein U9Q81_24270 [Pseudomonadota bacterium]|nr:hypothetical protein [Pseudomonadota bacterium]